MNDTRRTFGPVLLVGLAAGTLAAVAGARDWVVGSAGRISSTDQTIAGAGTGQMPLAASLALVLLACWGVVLVTRGGVRRVVAALAALSSAGLLATCVAAWWTVPASVTDTLTVASGGEAVRVSWTGWYPAACAAAVLSLLATGAALRLAPGWPEMGRRYDAPGGSAAAPAQDAEPGHLELWKALDEGRDPTDPGSGERLG